MNKYKYIHCALLSDREIDRCGYRKRNPAMRWMNSHIREVTTAFIERFHNNFYIHFFDIKERKFDKWFSTIGSRLQGEYKTDIRAYLDPCSSPLNWTIYDPWSEGLKKFKEKPDNSRVGYIDFSWGRRFITYSDLSKEDQFIYDVYAELHDIGRHVRNLVTSNPVKCLDNNYIYKKYPRASQLGTYSLYIGNIPESLNEFINEIRKEIIYYQIPGRSLYIQFTDVVRDGEDFPLKDTENIDAIANALESYENLKLLGVI